MIEKLSIKLLVLLKVILEVFLLYQCRISLFKNYSRFLQIWKRATVCDQATREDGEGVYSPIYAVYVLGFFKEIS